MTTNSEFVYTKPLVDVVKNGLELQSVDRNIKEKEDALQVFDELTGEDAQQVFEKLPQQCEEAHQVLDLLPKRRVEAQKVVHLASQSNEQHKVENPEKCALNTMC